MVKVVQLVTWTHRKKKKSITVNVKIKFIESGILQ